MSERRQVRVFVVLVLLLSWGYEAYVVLHGGVARFGLPGLVVLMWIPGLLAILLRSVVKAGFNDVRFIAGKPVHYAGATMLPLVLALLTALLCAVLDIRRLAFGDADALRGSVPVLLSILGFGLFGALGEELGWRGFLLPKMIAAGIRHPYLASGLVWACWHLPLIALGGFYATDQVAMMMLAYGLSIVAIGFVISEFRMRSGSVWVATVLHAAHNFFFQAAVPMVVLAEPGARSGWWEIVGGDSGFLVAALYAAAFVFLRRTVRGTSDVARVAAF